MSNLLNLFSDYEKRYHNWLNQTQPKVKNWYDQSGLDEKFGNIQQGLLGTESRQMHPTEGVVTGDRHGGIFGQGGSAGKALDYAGGKAADYFQGEKVWTPDAPTELSRTGVDSSTSMKHLDIAIDKFDKVINWTHDKIDEQFNIMFPNSNKNISNDKKKKAIENSDQYTDAILRKKGLTAQDGFSLSKWAGVNMDDIKKNWKDKGGMDGLMSNPAFTLGLALMQSSAQGKSIGEGAMDNFIKAAGISEHYKDRLKAKAGDVIQATEGQMENIETILEGMNIKKPLFSKVLKGNQAAQWEEAVESIANEVEVRVRKKVEAAEASGKDIVVNTTLKKKIIKEMEADGVFKRRKGAFWVSDTLFMPEAKAEGGPVEAGQPYLVGEKGPEVVIPKANATVVSNDDSQIMSMLLASNPQLQNVSRTRAESILRSRFPDYFA